MSGDIWDVSAGELGKSEGMARVQMPVPEDWRAAALYAVRDVATRSEFLTVDDVSQIAGDPPEGDLRVWGPIMLQAARNGWIEAHGYAKSQRASSHVGPRRLYRSLVLRRNTETP